ncbi:MAG TPA: hypothetical protein VLG44_08035, partial [Chlamydiales bacterium]|nr:hypothetical protein [Chlamydiales bacterium]
CMKAIVPAACAYDFLQGTRLFTMGSWSMVSGIGLLMLYLPSLLKRGHIAFQEWAFEQAKMAIDREDVQALQFFLGFLHDINQRDQNGDTLLHYFSGKRPVHIKMLMALKNSGADPFARNREGKMAIFSIAGHVIPLRIFFNCHGPAFQKCKTVQEFCELLFPAFRTKLPPYKDITQRKLKLSSPLEQFIDEIPTLAKKFSDAPSFSLLVKEMEKEDAESIAKKGTPLSIEEWTTRFLDRCPLYKILYEQARSPAIKEGELSHYLVEKHTVFISASEKNYEEKFQTLIFETFNALQLEDFQRIIQLVKAGEIHLEENAFLREYLEYRSYVGELFLEHHLQFESPTPTLVEYWVEQNKGHTDFYRNAWCMEGDYLLFFEKHPEFLKHRLQEINQALI